MKLRHIFVFIFVFSIEVKIKANDHADPHAETHDKPQSESHTETHAKPQSDSHADDHRDTHSESSGDDSSSAISESFVEHPDGCLEKSSFCTIRSLKRYAVQEDEFRISMKSDTVLMRHDPLSWSFVTGNIFIKTKKTLTFKTTYGEIIISPNTQCLIQRNKKNYAVQVLFGQVLLKGLGHNQSYAVLEGFENFLSQVDGSMKSGIGIPKPVLLDSALIDWNFHFAGTKKQFMEDVEKFKPLLETAKNELSHLNQTIVHRELASAESEIQEKKAVLKSKKEQKSKNQDRTFDRLLGD